MKMNSVISRLNYLEKMSVEFGKQKEVTSVIVELQLVLAQSLVGIFTVKANTLSQETFTETELNYVNGREVIPAIKSVRDRLNLGLMEAKIYVYENLEKLGYGKYSSGEPFQWNK